MRLAIALVLLSACAAEPVPPAPPPAQPKLVLVLEFQDATGQAKGTLAADHLIAALMSSGRVRVVDRSQAARALDEMKLAASGVHGPEAAKLGNVLGVDYVVIGSVNSLGARVESEQTAEGMVKTQISECRLSVKAISTQAGTVAAAIEGQGIAKRSVTAPARMSFDPTLAAESVRKGIDDVTGRLIEAMK
jgi:curli biogenesis system outer membrane secretion channel CsgG